MFNDNLRAVERGEFYRSAQMSPERLAYAAKKRDIKTLISLRGVKDGEAWRTAEIQKCEELGITRYDVPLSMRKLPPPESLKQLVELCKTAEKPILVHCQAGIHRAGTASAIYELLEGKSVDEAKGQFTFFFFDAPIGEVVELYRGSTLPFDEWVEKEYPALYEKHKADRKD